MLICLQGVSDVQTNKVVTLPYRWPWRSAFVPDDDFKMVAGRHALAIPDAFVGASPPARSRHQGRKWHPNYQNGPTSPMGCCGKERVRRRPQFQMLDTRAIPRLALHDPWAGLDYDQHSCKDWARRVIAPVSSGCRSFPLIQCADCDADDDKSVV